MLHRRSERPTLFELTTCNETEPLRGFAPEHAAPNVTPKSDPSASEGNVSSMEPRVFRAVSPLAFCGDTCYVAHKLKPCFVPWHSLSTP